MVDGYLLSTVGLDPFRDFSGNHHRHHVHEEPGFQRPVELVLGDHLVQLVFQDGLPAVVQYVVDVLCLERGYVLEVQLALVEQERGTLGRVLVVVCFEELPVKYEEAIFDLLGYVSPFHV